MNSLLRIFSFTVSSFRAIWYPFRTIFGSIFKTLQGRTCRTRDTEAVDICLTPASKIDSTTADAPDEEIVRLCGVNPHSNPIQYGRCFQRISDDVIVKFGWSVTEDEAKNQKYARILCRETKIMVPKVHRYFAWSGLGFIVMEFVHGDPMDTISPQGHPNLIENLAKEIFMFSTKRPADFPGPRNCGIPKGYLFSEDGAGRPLNSIERLNSWLNERVQLSNPEISFNFQLTDCVFCHMDLSRRNVIVQDHHFYLLDWEFAGFYPSIFEKYSILFIGQKEDYQFAADLSKALDHLYETAGFEANDERMIGFLNLIYRNNERYNFVESQDIDWKAVENFGVLIPS